VTVDRPSPASFDAPRSATEPPSALFADDLERSAGGLLLRRSARPIHGAVVDSRAVQPGQMFVALPGERTDGHLFLADAVAAGAAALVVTHAPEPDALEALGDVSVLLVPDALRALWAISGWWRSRFDPLVVGVTGSIAKTSTKEAIATVLAFDRPTLRNEGNQNNEIGLPLTLLRLAPEHRAAVLEMGMYVGGEIADLARLGRPSIGVVTAVHGVHLSRIGSIEAIERAKGELVEALPSDGLAVLNADDPRVVRMAARTAARKVTYGFDAAADVRAEDVASEGLDGMRFTLVLGSGGGEPQRTDVRIPTLGRLSVHNALAAAAVATEAGMAPAAIAAGLARGWSAPHRGEVSRHAGVTIVDDSYNASPASVTAALELLSGLAGRRIAVLGEMLELGDAAEAGHLAVGEEAASRADLLVAIGPGAAPIAAGALRAGMERSAVVEAADRAAALDELVRRLAPGDVVLVKASRGIELDLLVEALVAELGDAAAPGGRSPR
jgi:UDP-N-acetylmuramoyl-tripeptide--D-alanyl-D-alanine ligase